MSDGYTILDLRDLEPLAGNPSGGGLLLPVRHTLGLRAFGANAWTAEAGAQIVPPHEEDNGDEELYAVVAGRVTFTVGDERFDAPAGTLVHVLPGEHRGAVAEEAGSIVLAVGATPGKAFERRGWDDVVVAYAAGAAGRVEQGRAIMEDLPSGGPSWVKPYNLACYEARFGDEGRAREQLRAAFALSDDAREYAKSDSDLDSIRDEVEA
jgi:quercetin dioxygenase-like cupin family protein